jgi:hypothetical protein
MKNIACVTNGENFSYKEKIIIEEYIPLYMYTNVYIYSGGVINGEKFLKENVSRSKNRRCYLGVRET